MRIGIAKKDSEGRIVATLTAPGLSAFTVELREVANPGERSPAVEILYGAERCGALWKRRSRGENPIDFLSGPLESPVFPGGRIEIAVFRAKGDERKGERDITWSPPRADRSEAPSPPASGESQRASQAGPDDDDIPF